MEKKGGDIAVASPYHRTDQLQGVGAWRLLLSRVCSSIYRMISPVPLYTYTSIFRAYRWSVVENVHFEANGFVSAAEILIRAAEQGYKVVEVPMVLRARVVGTTKMKIMRTIGRHCSMMGRFCCSALVFGSRFTSKKDFGQFPQQFTNIQAKRIIRMVRVGMVGLGAWAGTSRGILRVCANASLWRAVIRT